jgi:hypothetical protein
MTMFQIVTNNARTAEVFETTDPVADFAARGFTYTGPETHGHLRAELRRKPRFEGLAGPMWGGTTPEGDPIIRYEDWDSYNVLSR